MRATLCMTLLLALAGCSNKKAAEKSADQPPPPPAKPAATCETAVEHAIGLMLKTPEMEMASADQQQLARSMMKGVKSDMLRHCKANPPSQPELDCVMNAKLIEELEKCHGFGAAATPAEPTIEELNELGQDKLVKLLGEPAKKSDVVEQGADGTFVSDWRWPDKGLTVGVWAGKKDGVFASSSVRITAPSALKTKAGIGLGSSADDVKKVYGKEISQEDSKPETIVVGSVYGGIFFDVADGKVTGIFLGAGAE